MSTSTQPLVLLARIGHVTHLTLNRPDKGNALDGPMARAFTDAVTEALSDQSRALVITARGDHFCVGGDVDFFLSSDDPSGYLLAGVTALEAALERLRVAAVPVVIGVNGAVAGAGLGMMLSGDHVIAGASATFTTGYSRVGLTPDCGLSWLLPRSVGHHRAMDLILTSRTITAPVAESWGLVSQVVRDGQVTAAALSAAARIAANPAFSNAESKRLTTESWGRDREASGDDEARTIASAISTTETRAAIEAFVSRERSRGV